MTAMQSKSRAYRLSRIFVSYSKKKKNICFLKEKIINLISTLPDLECSAKK
jgi:hypothetical protein